jgi:hypothetical protein
VHAFTQSDPGQQLGDVVAIGCRLALQDAQGQGGVVEHRQMLQQPKFLENHPDPATQKRQVRGRHQAHIAAEKLHATP